MNSELVIPANPAHVRTVRVVASVAARRSGVTDGDIDSVRLAVDEACGMLIRAAEREEGTASQGSNVKVSMSDGGGHFVVDVSGPGPVDSANPDPDDEIALTILTAIASEFGVASSAGETAVHLVWATSADE